MRRADIGILGQSFVDVASFQTYCVLIQPSGRSLGEADMTRFGSFLGGASRFTNQP